MSCQQEFPGIDRAADYGDRYVMGASAIQRVLEVYATYAGWIDRYKGGITSLSAASGMSWESRGNPLKFKKSAKIVEIGLWSITEGVAENYNIDPFDPEANIWAGGYLRNDRARRILEDPRYSWLVDAEPYDWTKIVWKLPGSLGFGGWKTLMNRAFPDPPPPGSTARVKPYEALRDWIMAHPSRVPTLGAQWPTLVACRVFRHHGVDFLESVGQLHTPGFYRVVPRPTHLPVFNKTKLTAVVKTPSDQRLARFPEYNRFPPSREKLGTAAKIVGGVAAAGALAGLGWLLWKNV